MKRLLFLIIFTPTLNFVFSQALHTPEQMLKIAQASVTTYEIDSISREMKAINYRLIEKGTRKTIIGDKVSLVSSNIWTQKIGEKYRFKANNFISKGKYDKANKIYKNLLSKDPDNEIVMLHLAKNCKNQGLYQTSIDYYEQLLDKNPADFELHRRVSEVHTQVGDQGKALHHAIMAHLMNRNDPEIRKFMIQQFVQNGDQFSEWEFLPSFEIVKRRGLVTVNHNGDPWKAYGLCKAVWENEEVHRNNMLRSFPNSESILIEEKECLLNGLLVYNKLKEEKVNYPAFKGVAKSLANKMIDQFIKYEILAKKDPSSLLYMEKEDLTSLIRYLKTIHLEN